MIKSVTVTNHIGESLDMPLEHPEKAEGLAITNIDGLGPVRATVNISESATTDGGTYNGSRLSSRNIILTFDFRTGEDIEHVRHLTYKYFPLKRPVKLEFYMDERKVFANGIVESNSPVIFDEYETTQVSVMCADPFLYAIDGENVTLFSGIEAMFEFPFENNHPTTKLIQFGEIWMKKENTVYYTGDSDIGITITIHALNPVKNITIYNSRRREVMRIDTDVIKTLTGAPYSTGDDIIICTKRGMKGATLLRGGVSYNILNAIRRGSDWFLITKGDNLFAYSAEEGTFELYFQIVNDVVYDGV